MVTVPSLSGTPNVGSPFDPNTAVAHPPRKSSKLIWVIPVALCCLVGVPIALLAHAALEAGRWAQCNSNLKQLGVALHNYHAQNGCFPPPYIADENGKPMHSWRVLLLPYLEGNEFPDRYRFDEPWNSPHNSKLAAEMPLTYRCPSARSDEVGQTHYVAVVGPGLLFDPTKTVRIADVTDGISNTLAIVESSGPQGTSVNWMSPDDLRVDTMNPAINGVPGPAISSEHRNGLNVLAADGAVHFLADTLPPEIIQSMLTISGGEDQSVIPFYD